MNTKPQSTQRLDTLLNNATAATLFLQHQRRLWWFLGISVWFLLTFFHQRNFDAPTPVSRLDLIMAMCLEGRLEIDTFHKNTPDKALINGHYYSDKAPGTVALALLGSAPAIWIGQVFGLTAEDKKLWLLASWSGCAVLNIILAAGFVCLLRLLWDLLRTLNPNPSSFSALPSVNSFSPNGVCSFRLALATTIFIIFGGMAWPYATMMFSHAQTIGCIAIGLWFLHRSDPSLFSLAPTLNRNLTPFLPDQNQIANSFILHPSSFHLLFCSGFFFGWALNSEYTTGLIVFGVPLIAFGRHWGSWIPFILGLSIPCLLIPLYSWGTIGIPWQLPYSYQAAFPEMQEGLYAIKSPNLSITWNLLFSPERGLIFWSPFLAVSIFGYAAVSHSMRVFLITYLLPLLQLLVISGRMWDWPAGPTFSARYLAPILPLLAVPCALALRDRPRTAGVLGLASLLLTGIATITNATPPFDTHPNPFLSLHLPLLAKLDLNPNFLTKVFYLPTLSALVAVPAFFAVLVWFSSKSSKSISATVR